MPFYAPIFLKTSFTHAVLMYARWLKKFFFIIEVPETLNGVYRIASQKLGVKMEMRMFEGDFSLPRKK